MNEILDHLRVLVGYDTRNPPRAIGREGLFDYLRAQLHGFEFTQIDHGAGAICLLATRGKPRLIFNVHLDTVPDSPHWSANPFELRVQDDRAIGLGACDIKGAAAALLAVANASQGDFALLFTTDEEANDARCVAGFLREHFRVQSPEPRVFNPSSSPNRRVAKPYWRIAASPRRACVSLVAPDTHPAAMRWTTTRCIKPYVGRPTQSNTSKRKPINVSAA